MLKYVDRKFNKLSEISCSFEKLLDLVELYIGILYGFFTNTNFS